MHEGNVKKKNEEIFRPGKYGGLSHSHCKSICFFLLLSLSLLFFSPFDHAHENRVVIVLSLSCH